MKQRVEYIDIMRGIAMLLVVLGHCSQMDTINRTLLTFHMPLFFYISGLCFSIRGEYKAFINNKLRTIMVPHLTLGVISVSVGLLYDVFLFHRETLQSFDYLECFSQWFLITLFCMYAIIWWVLKILKTKYMIIISTAIIGLLFLVVSWNEVYYFQQTICALFFALIGYLSRPLADKYNEKPLSVKGFGIAILMVISIIACRQNLPILMYVNQYGNKFVFLCVAVLGIIAITDISCCLKQQRFIQWIGRNSITIFITHFALLRVLRGLFTRMPDPLQIYSNSFFLLLLVITIEIPIIHLTNKYWPQIVGKKI